MTCEHVKYHFSGFKTLIRKKYNSFGFTQYLPWTEPQGNYKGTNENLLHIPAFSGFVGNFGGRYLRAPEELEAVATCVVKL